MILNEYTKKYFWAGIIPIFIGSGFLVYFELLPWWQSRIAEQTWEKVPAVILKHSIENGYEGGALSQLLYQYSFAGKTYTSDKYSFERGRQLLSRKAYPMGREIACYVNTQKPAEAVISTSFAFSPLFGIGIIMLLIGAVIMISILLKKRFIKSEFSIGEFHLKNLSLDPLMEKTRWTPLPTFWGRAASFKTYVLHEVNSNKYIYQPTCQFYFLCFFTFLIGCGLIVASYWNLGGFCSSIPWGIPFSIGLFLVIVAVIMLSVSQIIVFDKNYKAYWYYLFYDRSRKRSYITWEKIHAIQLLQDRMAVGGEAPDVFVFQMNFVLVDGKRINIVTHTSLQKIREEAKFLSVFLEKIPIWDIVDE